MGNNIHGKKVHHQENARVLVLTELFTDAIIKHLIKIKVVYFMTVKDILDKFQDFQTSGVMEDLTIEDIYAVTEIGYSCTIANGRCMFALSGEDVVGTIKRGIESDSRWTKAFVESFTKRFEGTGITVSEIVLLGIYRAQADKTYKHLRQTLMDIVGGEYEEPVEVISIEKENGKK